MASSSALFDAFAVREDFLFYCPDNEFVTASWTYPHMAWESYQNLNNKRLDKKSIPNDDDVGVKSVCMMLDPQAMRTNHRLGLPQMNGRWEEMKQLWLSTYMPMINTGFNHELQRAMEFEAPPCGFYILGIGSVANAADTTRSMVQLYFARNIITICLAQTIRMGDIGQVFIDRTHFLDDEECEFVKSMFIDIPGLLKPGSNCEPVYVAPIGSLFASISDSRNFIISFTPENPIRQIVSDLIFPYVHGVTCSSSSENKFSKEEKEKRIENVNRIPQAVVCPSWKIDSEPKNVSLYAGDRSSTRVQTWLQLYNTVDPKFNGIQKQWFGDITLFKKESSALYPDPTPLPSTRNTPEAEIVWQPQAVGASAHSSSKKAIPPKATSSLEPSAEASKNVIPRIRPLPDISLVPVAPSPPNPPSTDKSSSKSASRISTSRRL